MKFVRITKTLSTLVPVEADTDDAACTLVKDEYDNLQSAALCDDNDWQHVSTTFEPVTQHNIITALEHCTTNNNCSDCPYRDLRSTFEYCPITKDAMTYIRSTEIR